jgi:hypothetical protein
VDSLFPLTIPEPLSEPLSKLIGQEMAEEATPRVDEVDPMVDRLSARHQLGPEAAGVLREHLQRVAVQNTVDQGIRRFKDDPEVLALVRAASAYFPGNPRELKRFSNSFRFQYFLWWARRAQGLKVPSLAQMQRWTVLSMRWPEVVRWARRSGGTEWRGPRDVPEELETLPEPIPHRLKLLEDICGGAKDIARWQEMAAEKLRLDPKSTPWLQDDDLLEFLHDEVHDHAVDARLSAGLGSGLW